MATEVKKAEVTKDAAAQEAPKKESWKNIAEVRMLMYVVPVAIVLLVLALLLGK